ncbi:MAG: hypothetical protein WCJ58_04385 [bacterium]
MKIYPQILKKDNPIREDLQDFYYFGDPQEIHLAISKAKLPAKTILNEKLHCHLESYTYFITIQGEGYLEVEGEEIHLTEAAVIEIAPGEKYRVLRSGEDTFAWIVVGTKPGNVDKSIF